MIEGELPGEGESLFDGRKERLRSESEQSGAAFASLIAETMPGGSGEAFEFSRGCEVKIEENEREIAVAEKEIGALDGLGDFPAADPEELLTLEIAV